MKNKSYEDNSHIFDTNEDTKLKGNEVFNFYRKFQEKKKERLKEKKQGK